MEIKLHKEKIVTNAKEVLKNPPKLPPGKKRYDVFRTGIK